MRCVYRITRSAGGKEDEDVEVFSCVSSIVGHGGDRDRADVVVGGNERLIIRE